MSFRTIVLCIHVWLYGLWDGRSSSFVIVSPYANTNTNRLSHYHGSSSGSGGSSSSSLHAFNFGNTNNKSSASTTLLPRDVKDAVSKCRVSVQEALKNRLSRMDIEMPVGAKYGVEKTSKNNKKKKDDLRSDVTYETLQTSDRELARLFVDMFQPVGGDNIATIFSDDDAARKAFQLWKSDTTATCQIRSMNSSSSGSSSFSSTTTTAAAAKKKEKKKKKSKGFAAKLAEELSTDNNNDNNNNDNTDSTSKSNTKFTLPSNTEVALFVSPTPKDLITIERICDEAGMGTLVILLNARLNSMESFYTEKARTLFLDEFTSVFHLAAATSSSSSSKSKQQHNNYLLQYRAYPNDWILARKPKIGQPKVISTRTTRHTEEDCTQAYESYSSSSSSNSSNKRGDFVEETMESVLENVANWFQ